MALFDRKTRAATLTRDGAAYLCIARRIMKEWDEQETLRKLHEWNQPIHPVRGRIEKIFGTWQRCYAFAKCDGEVSPKPPPKSTSTNLKRTTNILAAQV